MLTLPQVYPTDLTTQEGQHRIDFFPPARVRGRPRKWEPWVILNALLDVTRTGCQGRRLPRDFPPGPTVYGDCWRWTQQGRWERLNPGLGKTARQQGGRTPQPRAALIASQSVQTSEGGAARGGEVHTQTPGRKRHLGVDVLGWVLLVGVHSAGSPDGTGGKLTLPRLCERLQPSGHKRWWRLNLIWADGGYRQIAASVRQPWGWCLEVVSRPAAAKGFTILPWRWGVERSLGWLGRYRRLGRDFEHTTVSSDAMVYVASIRRTLRVVTTEKAN